MKCSYHPGYQFVSSGTPSTAAKFLLLKDRLLEEGILTQSDLIQPEPLERSVLELIHSADYLDKLESSALTPRELRLLGMPWSDSLWLRSRLASGGTLLAARAALQSGLSGNLAGGSHHAFADHGEGFCVLNDVAIATAKLRAEHRIERAVIIDLDVHQGNGTAAIFEQVSQVVTFSMHGDRNYPAFKVRSTVDVALPDGVGDAEYLECLAQHLPCVLRRASADIAFYLAGVDVAAGDRYGKLSLSDDGIRLRERMVIEAVCGTGVPLVIVLAGGYAPTRARTAELHAYVFREAVAYSRRTTR